MVLEGYWTGSVGSTNPIPLHYQHIKRTKMKKIFLLLALLAMGSMGSAQQTKVMIRAKAKDAKFIGSSIGGAHVLVKNTENGQILAEGITQGSTGNTDLIMNTPKGRHDQISDGNTAGFLAVMDLERPTFAQVEVRAPYHRKNAMVSSTTQLWLIPGKDILGDGIQLEFSGYVVDILTPNTHQYVSLKSLSQGIDIRASIVMMCGCPIEQGGLWDSSGMEARALVKKDGKDFGSIDLVNPSRNIFEGRIDIRETGNYGITLYAYDPNTGNTGLDRIDFVVTD